jgi:hypothetical protein
MLLVVLSSQQRGGAVSADSSPPDLTRPTETRGDSTARSAGGSSGRAYCAGSDGNRIDGAMWTVSDQPKKTGLG